MIEQRRKTPLKLPGQKSEISTNLKLQSISKKNSFGISRTKTEAQIILQNSAGKRSKNRFGDDYSPTIPGHEISEGVEELINQVSNCVEKKNLDKTIKSVSRPQKDISSASFNNKSFQEDSDLRQRNNKSVVIEKNYCLNNFKLLQYDHKKPERNPQNKKKMLGNVNRKRDQTDEHHQMKFLPSAKKSVIFKRNKPQSEISPSCVENKKRTQAFCNKETALKEPGSTNKLIEPKKRKPSEIPLRKTRLDGSRKPKAVSTLLQKPLKEIESSSSTDFFFSKKTFSPIDELSLCSELQITINAISSSEKLDNSDSLLNSERPVTEENVFNIKLERCFENPNILNVSEITGITSAEFLEEKSSSGKKAKLLDLEKVKTSSFTVLQTSPYVLDRLESFHKQNVLTKKKMNVVNAMKPKPSTPKQFFNSLKRRGSRKSLSSRLSDIRNKSSLKIKVKKSKKEVQEDSKLPEKFLKPIMNTTHFNVFEELLAARRLKNVVSDGLETESSKKQVFNTKGNYSNVEEEEDSKSSREKSVSHGDKSFLKKLRNSKEKEESKIPTPQKFAASKTIFQNIENSEKSRSFSNSAANTNNIESIDYLKPKTIMPITPSSIPGQSQKILKNGLCKSKEEDENLSNTVIVNESGFNSSLSKCNNELKKINKPAEAGKGKAQQRVTESKGVKSEKSFSVIRGTALKFGKNEILEKQDSSKEKVKKQLKIDLNLQDATEESSKNSCDWLFKNDIEEPNEELLKEEKVESSCEISRDTLSPEWAEKTEKNEPSRTFIETDFGRQETPKSCSLLKGKILNKMSSLKTKGIKKKIRSDAGDRRLPSFSSFFGSDSPIQNEVQFETKLRNSLTKSNNKEDQREIFEEEVPVKLKRRNSEPISLTGYIWKRTNFPTFRGHKLSVSSSSLRHLNTDDFDDFIFWEPVPQKMTSCWEMSLYQFKKPWSVLSCSVFRDNRLSSTPGLILENLRNGGNLSMRQSAGNHSERVNCAKENPFDVEPSIAQKNIDIKNWLAALNFPTSTSNSSDVISEGIFTSQSIVDSQSVNKAQVNPKRRKVLRNSKFLDKTSQLITRDENQYLERKAKEEESFGDFVQGKSGEFIINKHLDSKYLTRRLNLPCLASKSTEEKSLLQENDDRNTASESKVFKKLEFKAAESGTIVLRPSSHLDEEFNEQLPKKVKIFEFDKIPKEKSKFLSSELNIWKHLFIFTLFIIIILYYTNSFTRFSIKFC